MSATNGPHGPHCRQHELKDGKGRSHMVGTCLEEFCDNADTYPKINNFDDEEDRIFHTQTVNRWFLDYYSKADPETRACYFGLSQPETEPERESKVSCIFERN